MRTVLITGASRGLGLEFARQYAEEGWRVIATCREPAQIEGIRAVSVKIEAHPLDLTDVAAIAALGRTLHSESIDVLIANAGVLLGREMSPHAIDPQVWIESFQVNAMAPLACAGAFLEQVSRSREKKMVAISSLVASIGASTSGGHYPYRASKSALNAVWRAFALDHPEVIAVILNPGRMRTGMTRYDRAHWNQLPLPEERARDLRKLIARLEPRQSGRFFQYTGESIPW